MAKVHNLAFDYSAYDNAQEAEAQRAIKYKKNPALKQKTVSVVAVISICLLVAVVLGYTAESKYQAYVRSRPDRRNSLLSFRERM
mgnify:CR=1 FL=1